MKYREKILVLQNDPENLEDLYCTSLQEKNENEFRDDLLDCYQQQPENILLQAWYYRLAKAVKELSFANWKLGIPIAIFSGLLLYFLSADNLAYDYMPYIILYWSPIVAFSIISYLLFTARKGYQRAGLSLGILLLLTVYIILFAPNDENYRILMAVHLPLVSWVTVGIFLLGFKPSIDDFFAYLNKSIEVVVTAGLYLIAGYIFVLISILLFETLRIYIPDEVMRLIATASLGGIPVIAVLNVYNPHFKAEEQEFERGLSRLIATLPRVLLVLSIVVLIIYLVLIPFNFMEPFEDRDVLMIYNVLLFAIMALLIGATPLQAKNLSEKSQNLLRLGIRVLTVLVILVSLYALSATVYRTFLGGITMNRLTIIGWNVINIIILILLNIRQFTNTEDHWADSIKCALRTGSLGYIFWAVFLILSVPLLF